MSRPVSHQLDIYGAWLHVCPDKRAWATLRRTVKDLDPLDDVLGRTSFDTNPDGSWHLSVYLNMATLGGNNQGLIEILTHEATHAACMLLDRCGQDYDGESEALAYLVGWMAAFIWEACES